jgi:hypothetical protein
MINLWDGWVIDTDNYQYILGQPETTTNNKRNNKEETRMNCATYHATLPQALLAFYRRQLRETIRTNDMGLGDALAASNAIEQRIRSLIHEPDFKRPR